MVCVPVLRARTMSALVAVAALTLTCTALPVVAQSPVRSLLPIPKGSKMTVNDAMFEQVPLNSSEPNACSPPEPSAQWHGVVIQAPTQVIYRPGKPVGDSFAAIPVCGFYRVEMGKLLDGKPLLLVAVNLKDQTRYVGAMVDVDHGLMAPRRPKPSPVTAEDVQGMSTDAYFNPNLARYVQLPATDAVYQVHAEYGGAVSNSVQIKVVRR